MSSEFPMTGWHESGRWLAHLALAWVFVFFASPVQSETSQEKTDLSCRGCNLILLNLDFLRSDYVGLTSGGNLTPNIDAYFRNGIVFENAYATAGSTFRGNVSVFSSTDPFYFSIDVTNYTRLGRMQEDNRWLQLFKMPASVAQVLDRAGYDTAALNKGVRSGRHTGLDRGFGRYRDFALRTLLQDLVADTVATITTSIPPFFVHLHAVPTRLHNAFYPRNRTRDLRPEIIYRPYRFKARDYGWVVYADYRHDYEKRRETEHAIYRQQLVYADDQLGQLFYHLGRYLGSSIVVLLSTHATQIGDNGIFASDGTGHEMNIRVPLMILHPRLHQTVRISTPVTMLDLVPTLLEMLEIEAPDGDGISLVPLLRGERYARQYLWGKNDLDDYILMGRWKLLRKFESERVLARTDRPFADENLYDEFRDIAVKLEFQEYPALVRSRTIVDPPWSLQIEESVSHHLYDIEADPLETNDLAQAYPETVRRLSAILDRHRQEASVRIDESLERIDNQD
jgi:arylsulfatase A-like enzyme